MIPNPDVTFAVPAGHELLRVKWNSSWPGLNNIAEFSIKALFDDSPDQQAGIMLYDVETSHLAYATVGKECNVGIRSLSVSRNMSGSSTCI